VLKVKFKKMHLTVVDSVNAAKVIDFLFQEGVVGEEDMHKLRMQKDPREQCRDLLTLLHRSEHPQAFIQLYMAIKAESHLQWLVDRIDKFIDQSVISLLQEIYASEPTGFDIFLKHICCL